MVDPSGVESTIDQAYASVYKPLIAACQSAYIAGSGSGGLYFQGLNTHTLVPLDGTLTPPNNLTDHPTYQPTTWLMAGYPMVSGEPVPIAVQAEINQYAGPHGVGYETILRWQNSDTGLIRQRHDDSGPEPWRISGWAAAPSG